MEGSVGIQAAPGKRPCSKSADLPSALTGQLSIPTGGLKGT